MILPPPLGVASVLSPTAALALAALRPGAVVVHAHREEPIVPPLALAGLSVVAAVLGVLTIA